MIIQDIPKDPEPAQEEENKDPEPGAQEEEKKKNVNLQPENDTVGKECNTERKPSIAVGAEIELLSAKGAEEPAQLVDKSEASPADKLNEQLENENIKRENQKQAGFPKKISEIEVINQDPYLKNFEHQIWIRINKFREWIKKFDESEQGILGFSDSYKKFGLNRVPGGIQYREWAPCAKKLCLCGDFNGWNRGSHQCKRNPYGVWELFLPDDKDGKPAIQHNSKVKATLVLANGQQVLLYVLLFNRLIVSLHG